MSLKIPIKNIGKRIKKDFMEYRLAMALFFLYYIAVKAIFHAYCPMILITGLPCPACGMTRAILLLFIGEWARAFALQPQAILWVLFGGWILFRRYIAGKKVIGFQTILIILLLSLIGQYLYRMMTDFPSYPPMTYRRNNLFSNLFNFYEELLRIVFKV